MFTFLQSRILLSLWKRNFFRFVENPIFVVLRVVRPRQPQVVPLTAPFLICNIIVYIKLKSSPCKFLTSLCSFLYLVIDVTIFRSRVLRCSSYNDPRSTAWSESWCYSLVYMPTCHVILRESNITWHLVFYVFLCCSVCWFLYGQFCHGTLKLDISTLFTTFFFWTSLQLISSSIVIAVYGCIYRKVC